MNVSRNTKQRIEGSDCYEKELIWPRYAVEKLVTLLRAWPRLIKVEHGRGGAMARKKKGKFIKGQLAVDFANAELNNTEDILDLMGIIFNYFEVDRGAWYVRQLKSRLLEERKLFEKLKQYDQEYYNKFIRFHEIRKTPDNVLSDEYQCLEKYFTSKNVNMKEEELASILAPGKNWATLHDDYLYDFYHFVSGENGINAAQKKLKDILQIIINDGDISEHMRMIEEHYSDIANVILRGDDTYLRVEKTNYTVSYRMPGYRMGMLHHMVAELFEPVIYYDLVEFLCTPDWIKLHQCDVCKKFFV